MSTSINEATEMPSWALYWDSEINFPLLMLILLKQTGMRVVMKQEWWDSKQKIFEPYSPSPLHARDQVGNVKPHSLCPLLETDITIVTNEAQSNKRKKKTNTIQSVFWYWFKWSCLWCETHAVAPVFLKLKSCLKILTTYVKWVVITEAVTLTLLSL